MTNSEKFCFRWNDFERNISLAFRDIREEKDFFDCTITCGARQIQAHKLILAACSPFFKSVFKQNPHQHPLLYLKGVSFSDLQAVLSFMYHGEVNVAQEELNAFLSVAEELEVKGLTQGNDFESSSNKKNFRQDSIPSSQFEVKKTLTEQCYGLSTPILSSRQRKIAMPDYTQVTYHTQQQDNDVQEVIPVVKQEPAVIDNPVAQSVLSHIQNFQDPSVPQSGTALASMDDSYGDNTGYDDYVGYGEEYGDGAAVGGTGSELSKGALLQGANQLCKKHDEKNFECLSCGKMFSDQSNCKRHIRHNHLGEEKNTICPNCNKVELKTNMKRHLKKFCVNRHLYAEEQHLQYY